MKTTNIISVINLKLAELRIKRATIKKRTRSWGIIQAKIAVLKEIIQEEEK